MSSFVWIKEINIDGKKATLEVMMGHDRLGDRCFCRINQQEEIWYNPMALFRADILSQGKEILKSRLQGKELTCLNGTPYEWED